MDTIKRKAKDPFVQKKKKVKPGSTTKFSSSSNSKARIKELIKNPKKSTLKLNMSKIEESKVEETKEDPCQVKFKIEHMEQMQPIRRNGKKRSLKKKKKKKKKPTRDMLEHEEASELQPDIMMEEEEKKEEKVTPKDGFKSLAVLYSRKEDQPWY